MSAPTPPRFDKHATRWLTAWLVLAFLFGTAGECQAYVDPNAGGWLYQLILPLLIVLGALATLIKRFFLVLWNKLFRRSRAKE